MNIEINGESKAINSPTQLDQLIEQMVTDPKGLAVAVNNTVIPRNNWADTPLNEADKVLLIRATQGG